MNCSIHIFLEKEKTELFWKAPEHVSTSVGTVKFNTAKILFLNKEEICRCARDFTMVPTDRGIQNNDQPPHSTLLPSKDS